MRLALVDYAIIGSYFAVVLGIGVALKRRMRTSLDFLLAGRAIPAWAAGPVSGWPCVGGGAPLFTHQESGRHLRPLRRPAMKCVNAYSTYRGGNTTVKNRNLDPA